MKNGSKRFDYYLDQLQALLIKSSRQKNPALWLYQHNARTPLFMLEALSKLYAGIHNKKKFSKLDQEFKLLEDILGAIDYYDAFAKEFIANKRIPATVTGYLQAQTMEKIQQLNEVLVEKEWHSATSKRMNRIRKKLAGADWLKEKEEMERIREFYESSIQEIIKFTGRSGFHFQNVEADVHELRRKMRWLSIYPHALRGCIQLGQSRLKPKYLSKYLSKEITSSPFNKFPDAGDTRHFLLLDKNHFYSLSWMIAELGKLKDNGLRVIAIKEALKQTSTVSDAMAFKKAYSFTGAAQPHMKQLLDNADRVCKKYFRENNLPHLLIGTAAVN